MSKQRYIRDSFWTDPYVEKLSPDYKLIFLYLLTNPLCNIAGVYEIRLKRMAFETGYDVEVVETILKRFVKDGKLILIESWIIIVNHLKHQYLGSKTAEGINRIIEGSPETIRDLFSKQIFNTNDSESYEVYVLKNMPHICPIQGVSKLPYSKVELSKVILGTYGELKKVKLSDEEYAKLVGKYGENNTNVLIGELDSYIASTGKRYQSHYATLINWARRKYEDHQKSLKGKKFIV